MTMTDPLGDMLTRIRNANGRKKTRCRRRPRGCAPACSTCCSPKATSAATSEVDFDNGKSEIEIELKYFEGAAGDPRDRARLEARPPRLRRR